MTSRERFLKAMTSGIPDRVPVVPDISNYIPAKRTGLPYFDIYFNNAYPLWLSYLDTVDHYGFDAWIASCYYPGYLPPDDKVEVKTTVEVMADMDGRIRRTRYRTPDGDMETQEIGLRADPPTLHVKMMRSVEEDWKKFQWINRPPLDIDRKGMAEVKTQCHQRGHAFGVSMAYPGFQWWFVFTQGGIEELSLLAMEQPELLDRWYEQDMLVRRRELQLILSCQPDYVLLGGSGTITLASPNLARKYALPGIAELCKQAKDASVPTMLHSCGKSRALVKMLAEETSLNCVNPLEHQAMGDVDLAEVKQAHGRQLSLMGNLHTTEVMLRGTPELVRQRARQAIADAGTGGGFLLSSGDQCGRDTPEENFAALLEAGLKHGIYNRDGNLINL